MATVLEAFTKLKTQIDALDTAELAAATIHIGAGESALIARWVTEVSRLKTQAAADEAKLARTALGFSTEL